MPGERGLSRKVVAAVIKEIGDVPLRPCVYGFDLGRNDADGVCRLEAGSGIAGRGEAWKLVRTKNGRTRATAAVTTRKALRRLLREFLAGLDERPPDRPGYVTYAKLNLWVWNQQRVRDAG